MEPADLTIQQLKDITDGFSEERLLGIGSYGKVYKGIHKNGDEVAVKMLYYQLGDEEFRELQNHMGLNHPYIVRVVGYCNEIQWISTHFNGKTVLAEQRHRALCLEYMHNGSLQKHISEECDGLDWHTRFKIIKGTSEGLQYLHEGYKVPIFHLDLKPDNILLDRNMVPKLADFGVSPFGERDTASILYPVGTVGYLAPEFLMEGDVSKKADIYSLGVVMLKIIAGPKGSSKSAEMSRQEFIDLVQGNWRNRLQATLCGSCLEACCQQVKMCTEIALDCAEFDRHKRPSITAVIRKLNAIEELKNVPVSLVDKNQSAGSNSWLSSQDMSPPQLAGWGQWPHGSSGTPWPGPWMQQPGVGPLPFQGPPYTWPGQLPHAPAGGSQPPIGGSASQSPQGPSVRHLWSTILHMLDP